MTIEIGSNTKNDQYKTSIDEENIFNFQFEDYKISKKLYDYVNSDTLKCQISGLKLARRAIIQIQKKKRSNWKSLTLEKSTKIQIDWNKFEDMDELTAATHPLMSGFDNSKKLKKLPLLDETSDWKVYFKNEMTCAQRMLTMVHMWNAANITDRQKFVKKLISILEENEKDNLSNLVKGGEEVLRDLDPTTYYEGVTYAEEWIKKFINMDCDNKVTWFNRIYAELDSNEKGLVLGALV
eukprot:GHVL01014152.1.p1 GENE.GHVL01014152.1~~GHVL01014152.1.p1  ORF type:complete len:261 (+),score=72.41 GHVL01014152.1:72-785(+)